MFDPFKRARSKAAKKVRRAALSALTDAWGTVLVPAKPTKRNVRKKPKTSTTARHRTGDVSSIRAAIKPNVPTTAKSKASVPRGATFRKETYESAFGTRNFRLYVPTVARTAQGPLPLIVMLHGCGQTTADFARGTGMNALAEEFGFLVLYPEQAKASHQYRCWNWYRRGDQTRGAGEPALLSGLTRQIIVEYGADPAKVYVAGLSAGASAALVLSTEYPDIFAAVGSHSGLAVGAAHDAGTVPQAMQRGNPGQRHDIQMPTIIFHGDADKTVNPRNGRFIGIRALEPYRHLSRLEKIGRVLDGREYVRTVHRVGKGRPYVEQWVVHGSGHSWSGGHAAGSYTDPKGPDASREMVRFFLRHRTTKKRRSAPLR